MSESFREQVERVIDMSRDNGGTWDLSDNDQAALKAVLQRMAVIDAERVRLREALTGLVGASDRAELEALEGVMRIMPGPDDDKIASINAIQALIATL